MSWTDERIEKLTKMWEGGSTASQIAEELGGVSRNAVIGKAHRLGLKARPSPVKANEREAEPAAPATPKAAPAPAQAAPKLVQAPVEAAVRAAPAPAAIKPAAPVQAPPAASPAAPQGTQAQPGTDAPRGGGGQPRRPRHRGTAQHGHVAAAVFVVLRAGDGQAPEALA